MSRWLEETGGTRGPSYDEAFRLLAASGVDVHGEASYVAALVSPGATVLDAGCGTGRVAIELARRGYDVVGVDSDASMLDVARGQAPDLPWHLADLAELPGTEHTGAYDLVVAAGNVVVFLAPGSGPRVVAGLARSLRPDGLLVSGWRTAGADGPVLGVEEYDRWCAAAGLEPVARHSTWDGAPWRDDAPWCVAVHRRV